MSADAAMLDTWPAISLDELQARAAFLTRKDRKYLVPAANLAGLLAQLEGEPSVLEIAGRRRFGYITCYFDDEERAAYFGALRRRPRRFKVRTRLYRESGIRQLEVKVRDGRGRTVKERIAHPDHRLDQLTDAERAWLGAFPQVGGRSTALRHCLTTFYRRTTIVLPGADGRITIDRDLELALPGGAALFLPGMAIIETKGPGRATPLDRILWRAGYRPLSLSKFTIGLALLDPSLPSNRWHRLRQQLAATAVPVGASAAMRIR